MSNAFADGGRVNEKAGAFLGTPVAPTVKGRAYIYWSRNPGISPEDATMMDAFSAGYDVGAQAEYESVIEQTNEKIKRADAAADTAIRENAKLATIEKLEQIQDYFNEQHEWSAAQYISLQLRELDR